MSRGTEGREIFLDDLDRRTFCRMLSESKKTHGFRIFAYCLMGNHFHLLIQVGDSPLYSGMHQLLTRYSLYFNQRHDHMGHLFQSRYASPLCRQDTYLEILLQYIHLNPLRAGLVKDPTEWIWSGHRGLIGHTSDELLDLQHLAELRGESLVELRAAYLDSLSETNETEAFREYVPGDRHRNSLDAPSLRALAASVARNFGLSGEDLCSGNRGKRLTQAKLAFVETAAGHGHRQCDIAVALKCTPAAITLLKRRRS
jgi:REP element-mobilizing transposase RayT